MSKEVLKLALEALGNSWTEPGNKQYEIEKEAITALREALAEQPAQQDSTCSNALRIQHKPYPRTCKKCGLGPCVELAQQALDKKAENARELGLDYEPVWGSGFTNKDYEDAMRQRRLHQLTSPPAQRTWVGLTDEEIDQGLLRSDYAFKTAEAWRAGVVFAMTKLKEKNT